MLFISIRKALMHFRNAIHIIVNRICIYVYIFYDFVANATALRQNTNIYHNSTRTHIMKSNCSILLCNSKKGVLHMSIHKNSLNNTWYIKYKNTTKRGFKKKKDAIQYESKMKLSLLNNTAIVMFYSVIEDYLSCVEKRLTYGSYIKIKGVMYNIIEMNVKNKDIHKITEIDCRNFSDIINDLDYSTVHKNYILNCYKSIFKHAKIYFNLSNDPTYVIEPFKKTFSEKVENKEKELNVWTNEEFSFFINHVSKERYKYLFIILFYTGIRLGEALALKWCDFDTNILKINKSLTRKTKHGLYEIKDTKTVSSIRTIELGNTLSCLLSKYKDSESEICGFNEDWFIFGRIYPLSYTSIDREKEKAIKLAKVRRIRIHDFRHSHASNLISNGINIVAVSKRLGHSDIKMTLNVYTHLMEKNKNELSNFLDESSQNLLNIK